MPLSKTIILESFKTLALQIHHNKKLPEDISLAPNADVSRTVEEDPLRDVRWLCTSAAPTSKISNATLDILTQLNLRESYAMAEISACT